MKGMLLTEYNEAEQMELFKEDGRREGRAEGEIIGRAEGEIIGRAEGEIIGREKGIIETLISLVKDGILPIKDAAARAGITETAFKQKMTAK